MQELDKKSVEKERKLLIFLVCIFEEESIK
jgi:hypothetical protein